VKYAKPLWWFTIVLPLVLCWVLAFINPYIIGYIPYYILHFISLGFITLSNYELVIQIIGFASVTVHLGEAVYGYFILRKNRIRDEDGTWWVLLIFLIGYPQLELMKKGLKKKIVGPAKKSNQ